MHRRQSLPRQWLMTDERMGAALLPALARLPRGAGVIFRHYATPRTERRRLFEAARRIARARGLLLVLAGSPAGAIAWKADGVHGRSAHRQAPRPLLRTAPAHDRRELVRAVRAGADVILISPVFPTRSHIGARALGVVRLGLMNRGRKRFARPAGATLPPTLERGRETPWIVALGGMGPKRFRRLRALGIDGWAGIDAFLPESGRSKP